MNRSVEKGWNWVLFAVCAYVAFRAIRNTTGPWGIAGAIAAATFTPFVIGPVLIHRTHWSSRDPVLFPFDPDGPGSPDVLRSHFTETAAELDRLGFAPTRYYQTKQATMNADGSVLLFQNKKTLETARVLTAVSSDSTITSSFTVFGSEFSDGTQVFTSNRQSALTFPQRKPPYHGRAFPQVREVEQLLVVHRARVENLAAGRIAVNPVGDDPDAFIRRVDFELPYAHHVACGYTYVDEMARVQRMTWKGAILSTWKLLPPIKQIRLAWERMVAARELADVKASRPLF